MRLVSGDGGWIRRTLAVGMLAAFLPTATVGCFGKFNLTRKVYDWNQRIDQDKWIQWFAFLVLSIVQIYSISVLIDVILANSLEFWTGDNPITNTRTRLVEAPDGSRASLTLLPSGEIDVHVNAADGSVHHFVVARERGSIAARAADGTLIARVRDVDGRPALVEGALKR